MVTDSIDTLDLTFLASLTEGLDAALSGLDFNHPPPANTGSLHFSCAASGSSRGESRPGGIRGCSASIGTLEKSRPCSRRPS
jgi:hypothetical protein